jgi:hypothetical protein
VIEVLVLVFEVWNGVLLVVASDLETRLKITTLCSYRVY